jgi:predicted SAM-dependent methyltransferase
MPTIVRRLHWGCGGSARPEWTNSDIKSGHGIDIVADIREGLPTSSDTFEYAVSVHALQEIPYMDLARVLAELRRVLVVGGVLRLVLPDLIKGVRAYLDGAREYFLVNDEEAESLGAKLVVQLLWHGYSQVVFTREFVEELLLKAGFSQVSHCAYRQTTSPFPEIVTLDNRERESLFVEATK